MAVRKIRGHWYVDFRWQNERLRKLSPANTKGGAEAYEVQLRQLVAEHRSIKAAMNATKPRVEVRVPLLKDFVERWFRDYVAVENRPCEGAQKRTTFQKHILPVFGDQELDRITSAAVDAYKNTKREAKLSHKTINNHISMLHKCLDKAREWEIIKSTPHFSKLPVGPTPFKYLRSDEVDALLAAAHESDFEAMIVVAVRTGLRYSELIALEWQDIDFDRRQICVQRSEVEGHVGAPKNLRIRFVPMTSDVCHALQQLPRESARVFQRDGRPFCYSVAREQLLLLCRVAGIRPVTWHALRHTFASELARREVPLQVVKDLLGHSTLEMTLRYAHVSPDLLRAAISKLDPSTFGHSAVNSSVPGPYSASQNHQVSCRF